MCGHLRGRQKRRSPTEPADNDIEKCKAITRETLLDFLKADLDLAFTFLETANIEGDNEHRHSCIEKAALHTIRYLAGRLKDFDASTAIYQRADELEEALTSFINSGKPMRSNVRTQLPQQ